MLCRYYICRYAYQIVLQTRQILLALPSLIDISVPNGKHITVCGDVHGQVSFGFTYSPNLFFLVDESVIFISLVYV